MVVCFDCRRGLSVKICCQSSLPFWKYNSFRFCILFKNAVLRRFKASCPSQLHCVYRLFWCKAIDLVSAQTKRSHPNQFCSEKRSNNSDIISTYFSSVGTKKLDWKRVSLKSFSFKTPINFCSEMHFRHTAKIYWRSVKKTFLNIRYLNYSTLFKLIEFLLDGPRSYQVCVNVICFQKPESISEAVKHIQLNNLSKQFLSILKKRFSDDPERFIKFGIGYVSCVLCLIYCFEPLPTGIWNVCDMEAF